MAGWPEASKNHSRLEEQEKRWFWTGLVAVCVWLQCLFGKSRIVKPRVVLGARVKARGRSCKVEKEVPTVLWWLPLLANVSGHADICVKRKWRTPQSRYRKSVGKSWGQQPSGQWASTLDREEVLTSLSPTALCFVYTWPKIFTCLHGSQIRWPWVMQNSQCTPHNPIPFFLLRKAV